MQEVLGDTLVHNKQEEQVKFGEPQTMMHIWPLWMDGRKSGGLYRGSCEFQYSSEKSQPGLRGVPERSPPVEPCTGQTWPGSSTSTMLVAYV